MQAKDIAIATALDYTADGSISRERETRFNAPRQKKKFVEETIFFWKEEERSVAFLLLRHTNFCFLLSLIYIFDKLNNLLK